MEGNELIRNTLTRYGNLGVEGLKNDVQKVSATGKTAESIRYEVQYKDQQWALTFIGRSFFKALETGRGPRTSDEDHNFKSNMLEYMKARGIGADLDEKKREALARYLVLKINREGDSTYKKGGRIVYSATLSKLVDELINALKKDVVNQYIKENIREVKAA
jgi:hypothetical protein